MWTMNSSEKMCAEKSAYTTKIPLDEEEAKPRKICTRPVWTCALALLLVCLGIVLTVEFLYPVEIRYIDENRLTLTKKVQSKEDVGDKGPWHLDFLINPTRLCENVQLGDREAKTNSEIILLILVPSATGHFAQRRAIRRTWGSLAQQPQGPLRLGFMLGTTCNETETQLIDKESAAYGDIIQGDFEDTFRNLTTKSVLMLKWVGEYCPQAQYFLKADDDTFVNLHFIAQMLQREPYTTSDNFISGFIHKGAQPHRGPNEKYHVSEDEFPGNTYPPYASGSAYMSRGSTASKLFEASKNAKPFLPLEDVFITGLCADDIDLTLIHEPSFLFKEPPTPFSWSSYRPLATAHSLQPDDLMEIWSDMAKDILDALGLSDDESIFGEDIPSMGDDLFNMPEMELISKLLNIPGNKVVSSSSLTLSAITPISISSSGVMSIPETDIFNITFFIKK